MKHEKLVDLWNCMRTFRKINHSGTKYNFYMLYACIINFSKADFSEPLFLTILKNSYVKQNSSPD